MSQRKRFRFEERPTVLRPLDSDESRDVRKPRRMEDTVTRTQFGVPPFRSIFNGIKPLGVGGSVEDRERYQALKDVQVGRQQWIDPPIVSGITRDGRRGTVPQSIMV